MIRYLLGIDAGGTKTDFMLSDMNMNIISELTLGSANPMDVGFEQMQTVLTNGIRYCCDGIDTNNVSCFAGIAGGITGDNQQKIHSFLSRFNFGALENASDIVNCIAMRYGSADGISVIMGTGIAVFLQHKNTIHRIGGWGYLLDKGGSGYNIGADALRCGLGCYDGTGGSELLKNMLELQLKKPLPDALTDIYPCAKAKIASFAPLVFDAYRQNDPCATAILDDNIKEVTALIKTAFKIAQTEKIPVCINGGLTNEKEVLLPFFRKYLPHAELHFADGRPVTGALLKALAISETENNKKC